MARSFNDLRRREREHFAELRAELAERKAARRARVLSLTRSDFDAPAFDSARPHLARLDRLPG